MKGFSYENHQKNPSLYIHSGGGVFAAIRAKDLAAAAQYHAGGDFSAKGRGNRSLDWLYRQGDIGDGTAVCSRDGTSVLP